MTTLFEAAVQVLAGGAGPGAWTDLRLCSTPFTLAYSGATGDVVRFDYSYDGTRAVTGDQRTIGAGNGGAISFAPMDVEGNFIAANYVRCEVVSGNSGATATATATGASLSVAKTTVALTVGNTATPAAWVDTTGLIGPVTLFYEGFSGDQIYVQGSDTNGGGAVAVPYYPGPGTSARVGASWAITIPKLQKYLRTVRPSGTTAGALCGVIDATLAAGGGGASPTTQIWTSRAVADTAASGPLGGLSAANSVDAYSVFIITQTTAAVIVTLEIPSITTATRMVLLANVGPGASATLYAYGQAIPVGASAWFFWTGLAWKPANSVANGGNSGAVAVGSLDNTMSLIANGTQWAGDDGTATTAGRSTATAGAGTTLRGGTAGVAVSSGAGVGVTTAVGEALRMLPAGAGAGQTGRLSFRELAANGTNEVTRRAPDALAASVDLVEVASAATYPGEPMSGDTAGQLAFLHAAATIRTTTFAAFTQPAVGSTVDLTVGAITEISVGQTLYVPGGGWYSVTALPGGLVVRVLNRYSFNTAAAATVAAGTLAQMPEGRTTLSAASGTIAVAWANLTATPVIEVTRYLGGGAVGAASLSVTVNAGVGFTIASSQGIDGADVSWRIVRE